MSTVATVETTQLAEGVELDCGVCLGPATELVEVAAAFDLFAARCTQHVEEPPNHKRESFYTIRGTEPLRLTKEERKAAFAGTLKHLKRVAKPDQEAKEKVVLSWTRGGRQIVDYDTGATVFIPRQPRLWIVVKGWHLKAGSTEWETDVELVDHREQHRVLANGVGGLPREAGLKTRWGESVNAEGKVSDRDVPTKAEQHENWTPETERGYGGRSEMEQSADGSLVPSAGVDDATLRSFVAPKEAGGHGIEAANIAAREKQRQQGRRMREEFKVAREYRKGSVAGASAAQRRAERAGKRSLQVEIANPDGSTTSATVSV
jgi:hypothetical protein